MSTEIKPRKHADMAVQYMTDASLKCWLWNGDEWALAAIPTWYAETIYYVGHEAPTEPPKRKITIAGIEFDAPETEAPNADKVFWTFGGATTPYVWRKMWGNSPSDFYKLRNGFVHTTREAAELHSEALTKLNRQLCGLEDSE